VIDALRTLGGSGSPDEVRANVASSLSISDKEQNELMSSGNSRFDNQVAWARFYLAKAGYLDASRRGVWTLTEKGRNAHLTHQAAVQLFKDTHKVWGGPRRDRVADGQEPSEDSSPEAIAEPELSQHRDKLLALLKGLPPNGFERLCQRLLRESGFQQVTVTGRSGDGGIDGNGVVEVNPFVSFRVLFQCKRYDGSVAPSHVRDFRGAMAGRADKGIILTTGTFTSEARKEAVRDGVPPIELVDGEKLVDLFERLELGLKPQRAYSIDDAFFEDFRK
jgi:restriction system protein